jgi:RNA polymerase sigma-70 factor (ECF subfamily)
VVVDAQNDDVDALAMFCRSYWYPLYSYARMVGRSPADAEDLTQSFFELLFSRNILQAARRERGKLRSFLLRSFKNFSADEWRKRGTQKHGGHQPALQFETAYAEKLFSADQEMSVSPDVQYERAWAREILQTAIVRLRAAYELAGNGLIFEALQDHLVEDSSARPYKEIAKSLGMTEASDQAPRAAFPRHVPCVIPGGACRGVRN